MSPSLPMPEQIRIRPADEGVAASLGRLQRVLWPKPMHALVAEGSSGLLGLAHFLFHRSTTQLGPSCYLQDLYTVKAARGRGVARALIEEVYRRAKAGGSPRVYWQTQETNATAMMLYDKVAEKSGFIVYRKML